MAIKHGIKDEEKGLGLRASSYTLGGMDVCGLFEINLETNKTRSKSVLRKWRKSTVPGRITNTLTEHYPFFVAFDSL